MLETGKTDLLDKFWSSGPAGPSAPSWSLKEDGNTGFEFAPVRRRIQRTGPRPEAKKKALET